MAQAHVHVSGMPVSGMNVEATVEQLMADAGAHLPRVYVFVNAQSSVLRRKEPAYAALLESDLVTPLADGASLVYGAYVTRQGRIGRAPGPDVLEAACAAASCDATRLALIGGMPGTVERLADSLRDRHPGLRVALEMTPPVGTWSDEESALIVRAIKNSKADVVCLGISAPRQEMWAFANIEEIGRPVLCVGAAFDFLSGQKPRAPKWMRSIGMEWLFRLGSEPSRLWRRYLEGNTVFLGDLVRYRSRPARVTNSADKTL